jgi:hypothetical protein
MSRESTPHAPAVREPDGPASAAQLWRLNVIGVPIPLRCTKGQALELIQKAVRDGLWEGRT